MSCLFSLRLVAGGVVFEDLTSEDLAMSIAGDYENPADAESKGRELALLNSDDVRMSTVEALAGLGNQSSIHNFTGDNVSIWRQITLGENKSESGADYAGKGAIGIVNWYLHRIKLAGNADGEYSEPVRTVLYTDDGKILHFVSDGIVKAVASLIKVFGIGPYKPAIKVEILSIKTSGGFKMLTLIPAE